MSEEKFVAAGMTKLEPWMDHQRIVDLYAAQLAEAKSLLAFGMNECDAAMSDFPDAAEAFLSASPAQPAEPEREEVAQIKRAQEAESALASARTLLSGWLVWRRGKVGREPLTTNTRAWLASHPEPAAIAAQRQIQIRFDGPPGPEAGRFVECEYADTGAGVNAGEWAQDGDYWLLKLFAPVAPPCAGCAELGASRFDAEVLAERYRQAIGAAMAELGQPELTTLPRINRALATLRAARGGK